jgi:hypothetical protein
VTCVRLQHRMPLRAWRCTDPTSRTQPSVGKSTSRPLVRSLPASGALRATQEWLVLERDDQIIGFAYGQPLKRLAAFQWATEAGMSTSPITSAGGGRELYTQLLRWLTEPGYWQGFAGITQQRLSSILRVMRRATCWTRPASMNRLARPSPAPRVGYGPLKIRKDVRPSEQGRTKVELGRHCPVRTGTPLSSENTL